MGTVETPEKRKCASCTNEVTNPQLILCNDCIDKQDYSDVSIGLNSGIMNNEE